MDDLDFSVVVPVYNSEDTLDELFSGIKLTFDELGYSFEVIFVEDGGYDNSWDVLTQLKKDNPEHIGAIRLNQNYGQHNATFCGFSFARGKLIITMDDDLQNPPPEIRKLILAYQANQADVVYGIYRKKEHSISRNIASASVKKSSKVFLDRPGKGTSFRLIKKEIIDKITEQHHNFVFIDELLHWYTSDIEYALVEHHRRPKNKSGYSTGKLFKLTSNLMFYYTNIPLKIMVYGGLIISLISFLLGLQYIIKKLFFDTPLGYTSLIVAILFSTSIIVFSLGVIGGYLSRIYFVQNKRPLYTIREVLKD